MNIQVYWINKVLLLHNGIMHTVGVKFTGGEHESGNNSLGMVSSLFIVYIHNLYLITKIKFVAMLRL